MNEWRERLVTAWPKLVGLVVFAAALWVQGKTLTALADDDGLYSAVGWALAHGHLTYPHLPGTPPALGVGPAYPALLALVWHAWPSYPANQTLAALVDSLCFGAAAALLADLLRRDPLGGRLTRYLAVPCAFLAFPLLAQAGARQALPLFLALAVGAIAVLHKAISVKRAALAGILAGIATLTLDAGLGLILGLSVVLLRRDRRAAAALLTAAVLGVVPWLVWKSHAAALAPGLNPASGLLQGGVSRALATVGTAATTLAGGGMVGVGTSVVLVVLSGYGWWREFTHVPLLAAGLGGAALAAIVAPRGDYAVWIGLPWLVVGAAAAVDSARRDRRLAVPGVVAAGLVASVLIVRQVEALRGGGPVTEPGRSARSGAVLLTSFLVELPPGSVVATSDEARFFLATGRTSVPALTDLDQPPAGSVLMRRYCSAGVALIAVPDSASPPAVAVRAIVREQPASIEQLYDISRGPALYRFHCPR